jgi:hypothetical protein
MVDEHPAPFEARWGECVMFVEGLDRIAGLFECPTELDRDAVSRPDELGIIDPERLDLDAVEGASELAHCGVTAEPHRFENRTHRGERSFFAKIGARKIAENADRA